MSVDADTVLATMLAMLRSRAVRNAETGGDPTTTEWMHWMGLSLAYYPRSGTWRWFKHEQGPVGKSVARVIAHKQLAFANKRVPA